MKMLHIYVETLFRQWDTAQHWIRLPGGIYRGGVAQFLNFILFACWELLLFFPLLLAAWWTARRDTRDLAELERLQQRATPVRK